VVGDDPIVDPVLAIPIVAHVVVALAAG